MEAFTMGITKEQMVGELLKHQKMDAFVRGNYKTSGNAKEFKGCAVGCSIDSINNLKGIKLDYGSHHNYETHLGLPEWLARVEDTLFEGMSVERSKTFPLELIEAVNPSSDLNKIKSSFVIFLMNENLKNFDHEKNPLVVSAINQVIKLYEDYPDGFNNSAADSAADSADSAADSAYSAAYSAYSADSAARSAAYSAAFEKFADKLIELIKDCK